MSNTSLHTGVDGNLYVTMRTDDDDVLHERRVLKGWESMSGWYWFATELDEDTGNHFGYVQGMYEEWGYFSQQELESMPDQIWPIKDVDLAIAGRRNR
tara:strand:+ start:346 stop:639 length:294 start_codon:yes stop_codon:yes gene_type:complete